MIATHNINVDGKWYKAGEEYPSPEDKEQKVEKQETPVNEPAVEAEKPVEEKPAEEKPKTTRRKLSK